MIFAALPSLTGLYAAAFARRLPGRGWLAGCAVALAGEVAGDLLVLTAALVVSAGYGAGASLPPRGVSSSAATFRGVLLGAAVLSP
jgi:hypothetical protein